MSLQPIDPVRAAESCLVSALNGDEGLASWILADLIPEELAAAKNHFELPPWIPRGQANVEPFESNSGDTIGVVVGAHDTPDGRSAIYVQTHRMRPVDPAQRLLLEAARAKAAASWEAKTRWARAIADDVVNTCGADPAWRREARAGSGRGRAVIELTAAPAEQPAGPARTVSGAALHEEAKGAGYEGGS